MFMNLFFCRLVNLPKGFLSTNLIKEYAFYTIEKGAIQASNN